MAGIKIIYITSTSYSGSTLLSRLLNAHSQVVSVGEHRALSAKIPRSHLLNERKCSCGVSPLKNCAFWKKVDALLQEKHALSLSTINLNAEDDKSFEHHNRAFFQALQEVGGKSIIVDSSKNLERLARLKSHGFATHALRLQRRLHGVANSGIKYGRPWLKESLHYLGYYQRLYAMEGGRLPGVRYEQLARHPRTTLMALMPQLGLPFEEGQMDWAQAPSHYIGGNPMRFQKENTIQPDERWKGELSCWKKLCMSLLMLLCRLPANWQYWLFRRLSKKG